MLGPTPPALSRLLTQLLGRPVVFARTTESPNSGVQQIYGVYTIFPSENTIVVKADLPLLASFAGILLGLPDSAIEEHLKGTSIGEPLRDAIHEVLNIASEAMADEGRTSLVRMEMDSAHLDPATASLIREPSSKIFFSVSVDGDESGRFSLYSQVAPSSKT